MRSRPQLGDPAPPADAAGGVSSMGTVMAVLVHRRKAVALAWLTAAVASVIIAFLVPKKYTTQATFQLNTQQSTKFGLPEGLKMLDPKFNSGGGVALALAILDSRALAVRMIDLFHLKKRYRTKWEHLAIKQFRKNFSYEVFDEGIIQVSVTHYSQDTARIMADSVLAYLNREAIRYSTSKARAEFAFNKALVDSVFFSIDSLSREVIQFMSRARIIDFEKHVELSLKSYAKMEESLLELEGQYTLAKRDNNSTPQERDNLKTLIGVIRKRQEEISKGDKAEARRKGGGDFSLAINYDSIPAMGAYMAKIDLLIEKNKIMLKSLLPKTEDSRIKMVETTPVLNIIDPTFVPPYKSGPKRAILIILITLGAGCAATLAILIRELLFNRQFRPQAVQHIVRLARDTR